MRQGAEHGCVSERCGRVTSNCARHSVTDIELKVHNVCRLALRLLGQSPQQRRMVRRRQRLLLQIWMSPVDAMTTLCRASEALLLVLILRTE